MKTPLQAAHDLLYVMTQVGQAECYLDDIRLIIEGLQQQYAAGIAEGKTLGYEAAKKQAVEILHTQRCTQYDWAGVITETILDMQPEDV